MQPPPPSAGEHAALLAAVLEQYALQGTDATQ
jgi:hypothetical protein